MTDSRRGLVRSGAGAEDAGIDISRVTIVLDAADLSAVSSFWARLTGGTVWTSEDWHSVSAGDGWSLGIQLAPDHVPPQWPDGPPQQVHLDLHVEDLAAAHKQAMTAGAQLLQPAEDPTADRGFQVYADPAGHPFCLCWG